MRTSSTVRVTTTVALACALATAACTTPTGTPDSGSSPVAGATRAPATATPSSSAPTPLADLPLPRTEVAGTVWQDGIAVVGGIAQDGAASDAAHLWDPGEDAWRSLPTLPVALHHTATVAVGGELWVVGGYEQAGEGWTPTQEVWVLGPGEDSWRRGPLLPEPRAAHAAVALDDDRVVVIGGVGSEGRVLASTLVHGGEVWRPGPPLPAPLEHLAAAGAPGLSSGVVVVGGRDQGLASSTTSATLLDLDPGSTRSLPDLAAARSGFGAANVGDRVCVVGGEVPSGTVGEVECLGEEGWRTVATDPTPRHGLAVVALDGRLHTVAGGPEPGFTFSAVHWSLVPSVSRG